MVTSTNLVEVVSISDISISFSEILEEKNSLIYLGLRFNQLSRFVLVIKCTTASGEISVIAVFILIIFSVEIFELVTKKYFLTFFVR